jgi:hypothetical protein
MDIKIESFAVACLVIFVFSCTGEDFEFEVQTDGGTNAPETESRKNSLSTPASRGYSLLTPEQRAKAERQPWERPGLEHLKPPQEVLDARFGDRTSFVPNPKAIAQLNRLTQRWDARRSHLELVDGLDEAEIAARYPMFHDSFLREEYLGQDD